MKLLATGIKLPAIKSDSLNRTRLLIWSSIVLLAVPFYLFGPFAPAINAEPAGFFLLGISGAIFANSTGAGGGVVFIPVFNHLGFSEAQAIATSFGIQCFGMTAGAITWRNYHQRQHRVDPLHWQGFYTLITLGALFSVVGIWHNYSTNLTAPASLHHIFSAFSAILGVSILATIFLLKPGITRQKPAMIDYLALVLITYSGGLITAWLSVGVGEMVAFYLILRRFDVTMAVAVAVVISALTVWSAAAQHMWIDPQVNLLVLCFAGPGAVLGGVIARTLVAYLSARRLKIFFGVWLVVIGLAQYW